VAKSAVGAHILLIALLLPLLGACATLRGEVDAYLAGEPPFPGILGDPGSLAAEQIDRRVAFLSERLDDTWLHANLWQYTWLAINTGGAAWSSYQASQDHRHGQIQHAMEAGKSTIGITYLLTSPMPGLRGADPIRALPSRSREEKLVQLEAAERLFRKTVRRARQRKMWLTHIGNFGLHAIASSVLLGLGEKKDAWTSFLMDSAVGELQIWSRPWEPEGDWEEYERLVADLPPQPQVRWGVGATGGGLSLLVSF
jgi:hypothetical protein